MSILVVFVLENRDLGHNFLCRVTGYSKDTVTTGLMTLFDLGLISPVPGRRYNGWMLTNKLLEIVKLESSATIQDSFVLSFDESASYAQRQEILKLLHDAGIRGSIANKIALDSSITLEYVASMIEANHDSPTLLAHRIMRHEQP